MSGSFSYDRLLNRPQSLHSGNPARLVSMDKMPATAVLDATNFQLTSPSAMDEPTVAAAV